MSLGAAEVPSAARPPLPRRHQVGLSLACGLLAAAAGILALTQGWSERLEAITWDARVRWFARPAPADTPLRLILVDQPSLEWVEQELGYSWPWPRVLYGTLVDFCRRTGARGIGFDVQFSDPHRFPEGDRLFAEALGRAGSLAVVLATLPGEESGAARRWPAEVPASKFRHVASQAPIAPLPRSLPTASFPITQLAARAAALGHVRGDPDGDRVMRRVEPLVSFDGQLLPFLGMALVGTVESSYEIATTKAGVRMGELQVPLDGNGKTVLRFRSPLAAQGEHLYPAVSAAAVIDSELRLAEGRDAVLSADEFRDALVLFGVATPGLYDLVSTPVAALGTGVEVHATFVDNLINGEFLRRVPFWATISFIFLVSLAGAWLTGLARGWVRIVAGSAVCLMTAVAVGMIAYPLGYWWRMAEPVGATGLALLAGMILNYSTEGRRRRFLHLAFQHYLSPQVIERILEDPERLQLGGERRELTIFFSDLEGFTSVSEKLEPEELVAVLNDYLSEMTNLILAEDGTLDKFEGDAIIAFWGAPLEQADHALRACRAALACQARLAELRLEYRRRLGVDLHLRIGVHTGPVVVGNFGTHSRFDYTVIGDAANLASRLEGANKIFGSGILASEATWQQVREYLAARSLGRVAVVGRERAVRVFEPLDLVTGGQDPPWLAEFRGALLAVEQGRHAEALAAFSQLAEDPVFDPVSGAYERQLRAVLEPTSGPPGDWDGIWRPSHK